MSNNEFQALKNTIPTTGPKGESQIGRQSTIWEQFEILDKGLEELSGLVLSIDNRLSCVLKPDEKKEAVLSNSSVGTVELAEVIAKKNRVVKNIRYKLVSILDRLEL